MGRFYNFMGRKNESFGDLLLKLPWWVSATLGVLIFVGLRWGLQAWAGNDRNSQLLVSGFVRLAPLALVLFGLFSIGAFWFSKKRHDLVEQQTSLESLRNATWKDFEFLVAEAYRRHGYRVEYSLGQGADGGVDLVLRKEGRTSLVQCKQWKAFSVGVPVIREMFGLLTAEQADEAIIVTSGSFSDEAKGFAQGKAIELVDGPRLLALVQFVQGSPCATPSTGDLRHDSTPAPVCPNCGKSMVLRTSKRGRSAGNQFWGCVSFPVCKGTREY